MVKVKPRVFIGSAGEALPCAEALCDGMQRSIDLWSKVFELGDTIIERLEQLVIDYDYGVFLFTPDDDLVSREEEFKVTRDNVILEAGMFLGRWGRRNTVIVTPDDVKVKLPSDLDGVNTQRFLWEEERRMESLVAAGQSISTHISKEESQFDSGVPAPVRETLRGLGKILDRGGHADPRLIVQLEGLLKRAAHSAREAAARLSRQRNELAAIGYREMLAEFQDLIETDAERRAFANDLIRYVQALELDLSSGYRNEINLDLASSHINAYRRALRAMSQAIQSETIRVGKEATQLCVDRLHQYLNELDRY